MELLIIIVLILGVVAIAQLVRTFELTSELKGERPEVPTRGDNRFNANMMMVFLLGFFAFVIYQVVSYKDMLLPEPASEHGVEIDQLLAFNYVIIGIVFVITHIFLFYFAYKYYYREDRKAAFFTHSNKLELIWTVVPAIFLAVIIVYGLTVWNKVMDEAPDDAILMEIYSRQFDWTARYAGEDGKLGRANYRLIEGANFLGLDSTDQNVWDDKVVRGEFHIPINKSVQFVFRSQDVIHSAYMPHFRAQINTVPGMTTTFHFVPTITTEEMRKKIKNPDFNYILLCNKICGASHFNMQMNIVVDTEEDYQKWLNDQKVFMPEKAGQANVRENNSESNEIRAEL